MEDLCAEKHKRVDEKLRHHEGWLSEHEKKIDRLDRNDATNTQCLVDLCNQISSQTKAIWGLVSTVFVILIGFFVWYVQTGGVK